MSMISELKVKAIDYLELGRECFVHSKKEFDEAKRVIEDIDKSMVEAKDALTKETDVLKKKELDRIVNYFVNGKRMMEKKASGFNQFMRDAEEKQHRLEKERKDKKDLLARSNQERNQVKAAAAPANEEKKQTEAVVPSQNEVAHADPEKRGPGRPKSK